MLWPIMVGFNNMLRWKEISNGLINVAVAGHQFLEQLKNLSKLSKVHNFIEKPHTSMKHLSKRQTFRGVDIQADSP